MLERLKSRTRRNSATARDSISTLNSSQSVSNEVSMDKVDLLPEDARFLQQHFEDEFSRLMDEVKTSLSRAQNTVAAKMRRYQVEFTARHQALLDEMTVRTSQRVSDWAKTGSCDEKIATSKKSSKGCSTKEASVQASLIPAQSSLIHARQDARRHASSDELVITSMDSMDSPSPPEVNVELPTSAWSLTENEKEHNGDEKRDKRGKQLQIDIPDLPGEISATPKAYHVVHPGASNEFNVGCIGPMLIETPAPKTPMTRRHAALTHQLTFSSHSSSPTGHVFFTEAIISLGAGPLPPDTINKKCKHLSRLQRIEQSGWFDSLAAGILIVNAFFIGLQVQYAAANKTDEYPWIYTTIDCFFCICFLAELVVRIGAVGSLLRYFCNPYDWTWNWFDFMTILFSLIETSLALTTQGSGRAFVGLQVVRVLRVLRMVRVVRIIRVMRFFRSLRILIAAIFGTMKSGIWTAILLIMIVYLFALLFCYAVADYLIREKPDEALIDADKTPLQHYFGTLPRSIFTLYKAIVGGIDWETACQALSDVSGVCVGVFVFYIAFMYFVVLNVVAGLFLQTSLEHAQSEMHDVVHQVREQRALYTNHIRDIFEILDKSKDGFVTMREFEHVMQDPKMCDFFVFLGLQVSDAWTLFRLLDHGGTEVVNAEDFIEGCLRLRGHARSLDIAQIMYECNQVRLQLSDLQRLVTHLGEAGVATPAKGPLAVKDNGWLNGDLVTIPSFTMS